MDSDQLCVMQTRLMGLWSKVGDAQQRLMVGGRLGPGWWWCDSALLT